jgi:hypothetical protein
MIYLDNDSRSAMKADLGAFYDATQSHSAALLAEFVSSTTQRVGSSRYRRRFNRTPY